MLYNPRLANMARGAPRRYAEFPRGELLPKWAGRLQTWVDFKLYCSMQGRIRHGVRSVHWKTETARNAGRWRLGGEPSKPMLTLS
jgi:hypothetical protein